MTRKGFVKIADALREVRILLPEVSIPGATFDRTVSTIADALEEQSKAFDRDKFFAAIYHD